MELKKVLLAAILCCSSVIYAQNPAATSQPKDNSEKAELLSMAGKLVKYGYKTKTAMPLIQAVEIYNRVGVSNETAAKTKESKSEGVVEGAKQDKPELVSFDQTQLLADATKYADGNKNILALVKANSDTRGRVGGATRHSDSVKANASDSYNVKFYGGSEAIVIVSGDGDTDLDLYIYDENGNFITSDIDGTDDCVCTFNPKWTGTFKIKIINRGKVYNRYVLMTN